MAVSTQTEISRWRSSVDRFAELQFFFDSQNFSFFCNSVKHDRQRRPPGSVAGMALADIPVATGSSTPMKRSLGLRLESRGRGLLPALMSGACFSAEKRTGALMLTRKPSIISGRAGVAGHRSHGCFRVRAGGTGLRFSHYLSDGLARLRPLEGATS